MNRMFSTLTVKSFDEDSGIIKGIASTPTTDRVGDIVEPMGAEFNLPLPLHHEHDPKDVVGKVIEAKATPEGIEFEAQIAKNATEQINEVWRRVKAGLIPFVSVGFRAIEHKAIKGGIHFTKWAWDELSLTTVPANGEARITAIKSTTKPAINLEVKTMTLSEQIRQFQSQLSVVKSRMTDLVSKSAEAGRTLDADEEGQYEAAQGEAEQIEKHLARLQSLEDVQAKSAKPVQAAISVQSNLPKGVGFVAATKALMHAKGNPGYAIELARQAYPDAPQIEQFIRQKSAVAAATTTTHAALTTPGALTSEFIELLHNQTLVGRLSGFRRVPHGVKIPRQATGAAAYWVGEAKPLPMTNNSVDDLEISRFKMGSIATMSSELLMLGNPSIDAMFRDNILEAVAATADAAFIDSTNAGSAVKPKGITNGVTAIPASGVGPQHVRADIKKALDAFAVANMGTDGAVWLMHSVTASALAFMRNAMGGAAYPGMTINGGTLLGLPVLVSNSVPGTALAGYDLVLVKPSEIFRPDAPGIEIATSTEASLEFETAPTQAQPAGAWLVSLWQNDLAAVRVILFDGWHPRRVPCVQRVSGVKYDETVIEPIVTIEP